jgi:hypothetical protein
MPKLMREKMADEGLTSYIVTYDDCGTDSDMAAQFWAENEGHAGEQFDDSYDECTISLVETQDEYERRTGLVLGYGRSENA